METSELQSFHRNLPPGNLHSLFKDSREEQKRPSCQHTELLSWDLLPHGVNRCSACTAARSCPLLSTTHSAHSCLVTLTFLQDSQ